MSRSSTGPFLGKESIYDTPIITTNQSTDLVAHEQKTIEGYLSVRLCNLRKDAHHRFDQLKKSHLAAVLLSIAMKREKNVTEFKGFRNKELTFL
jgi:hypothetical protein